MDPPSLDPPPDVDYPGFADDNKDRRTLIFVGANDGMMHAIDGRTRRRGLGVHPVQPAAEAAHAARRPGHRRLRLLRRLVGQGRRRQDRRRLADAGHVRRGRRRHVLPGLRRDARRHGRDRRRRTRTTCRRCSSYFNNTNRIPFLWSFPQLLDVRRDDQHDCGAVRRPLGVGHRPTRRPSARPGPTRPSVRSRRTSGTYTVIAGSGFFPRSVENGPNRGGAAAGRSLYLLNAEDGTVFDRKESSAVQRRPGRNRRQLRGDGLRLHEVQERAAGRPGRHRAVGFALHRPRRTSATSTATSGASTSTSTAATTRGSPSAPIKLYVGSAPTSRSSRRWPPCRSARKQYLFFGTGSDLLPSDGQDSASYKLLGVLDNGGSGTKSRSSTRSPRWTAPATTRRCQLVPGGGRRHRLLHARRRSSRRHPARCPTRPSTR